MQLAVWRGVFVVILVASCASRHLVEVSPLDPGDVCESGGVVVAQGSDDNGDGVLQPNEIESSEPICNGGAGSAALVDTTPEAAGSNCPFGGTRVRTGIDANGDGVLDDAEVTRVSYVCSAEPEVPTLVAVDDEAAGANCERGGVRVRSGADTNHDGVLDDSEVTSTSYVCTGAFPVGNVIVGNFYLRNGFDQAQLYGVERITGTLYVQPEPSYLHPLAPDLEQVARVEAVLPAQVPSLSLPALTDVGSGGIRIEAPGLATLDVPALTHVIGNVAITKTSLSTIAAPQLATIGGTLTITQDPALTTLALPQLTDLGGSVSLIDFPDLATLALGALVHARGVELRDLPMLQQPHVQFGPIASLPDGLIVDTVPWTTLAPFASVTTAGTVGIIDLAQATAIDLPALQSAGYVGISGIPVVSLDGFGSLTTASEVAISSAPNLASIAGFAHVVSLTKLHLSNAPKLTSITGFSSLASVTQSLELRSSGLVELTGFSALTSVGNLVIEDQPALTSMTAFPVLSSAAGIWFTRDPALTTVAFPSLRSTSTLQLIQNDHLEAVSASQLEACTSMTIDAPQLTTLAVPSLKTVGQLSIYSASLSSLDGLAAVESGDLFLWSMPALATMTLPAFETGKLWVTTGNALTTIALPAFTSGALHIDSVSSLASLETPLVTQLTELSIAGSDALRSLRFPSLQRTRAFVLQLSPLLERVEMPALTQIDPGGVGVFVSAPRLGKCQITDILTTTGYTGNISLSLPECRVVDRCHLVAPLNVSVPSGTSVDAVGQLEMLGVTDTSAGIDASPVLRAQVGAGPVGVLPSDAAWTWADAAPSAGWNDANGLDEYRAPLSLPIGTHEVAARFSGDGGRTWTYCDSDGSDDGYQSGNAGHVEVQ